jgi:hypothetical protein
MAQVIIGKIKNSFSVNNCLVLGDYYSGGDFGSSKCISEEKVFFNAGDVIQSKGWSLHNDDSSNLDVPYQNGEVNIPMSSIEILSYKDVGLDEFQNYKNNLKTSMDKSSTNNEPVKSKENSPIEKTGLTDGQKWLAVIGISAVCYYLLKKSGSLD